MKTSMRALALTVAVLTVAEDDSVLERVRKRARLLLAQGPT
jgi:hypothetical protein